MNKSSSLSWPTIVLHWLTGSTFIAVFIIGLYMVELPRGPEKGEWIGLHQSIGPLILIIASIRLFWRITEGSINPLSFIPKWQEKLSHLVHVLLLASTIIMPISGMVMTIGGGNDIRIFGWVAITAGNKIPLLQDLGHITHQITANIIIAVLTLHIIGAFKHQFINKDHTLSRIFGYRR